MKQPIRLILACLLLLAGCKTDSPVPKPLADFGEAAEGAYDESLAGNWSKAAASVTEIKAGLDQLAPAKVSAVGFASTVAVLEKAVATKDRLAAMTAANELTRLANEAARPFGPTIPADVTALDCVGRDLQIAAEQGDTAKVTTAIAAVRAAWDKARPLVDTKKDKAAKPSAAFSATVAKLEKTAEPKQAGALAKELLDQVDDLEGVFH